MEERRATAVLPAEAETQAALSRVASADRTVLPQPRLDTPLRSLVGLPRHHLPLDRGHPMITVGLLSALNIAPHYTSIPLILFAFFDALNILLTQLYVWLAIPREEGGGRLYINELMVKKFSMLGCSIILLISSPEFRQRVDYARRALLGLIVDGTGISSSPSPSTSPSNSPSSSHNRNVVNGGGGVGGDNNNNNGSLMEEKMSKKTSAVLLVVRLLISGLFLWVGWGEVTRQWITGQRHLRPPGDGHDQMWLKIIQLLISIPFAVGFKTKQSAVALAVAMLAEALLYWRWWQTLLGINYFLHARDHFFTNIGVVGGLLLLQSFGSGRYSVDELLSKKHD